MKKLLSLILVIAMVLSLCACGKADDYEAAITLMEAGNYEEAIVAFTELGDYEDSAQKLAECENALSYAKAVALFEAEQYEDALALFTALGDYQDSLEKKAECENALAYQTALDMISSGDYENAYTALVELGDYKDVPELLTHFKEVEITPENWDSYFIITAIPEYTRNDFSEVISIALCYTLELNEDIAQCIFDFNQSSVIFELGFTAVCKDLQFDKNTGKYDILPASFNMQPPMEATETLKWEARNSDKPALESVGGWFSPPAETGQVEGYQYMWLAEGFIAIRTHGSIFIYE